MSTSISPATECAAGDGQIGVDETGKVNDHVVCRDGISSKIVVFHKHCHTRLAGQPDTAAADPHLRREYHIGLGPIDFSYQPKEIVS